MKNQKICRRCGDRPDPDYPGLGQADQGEIGGMGPCGDLHDWVTMPEGTNPMVRFEPVQVRISKGGI